MVAVSFVVVGNALVCYYVVINGNMFADVFLVVDSFQQVQSGYLFVHLFVCPFMAYFRASLEPNIYRRESVTFSNFSSSVLFIFSLLFMWYRICGYCSHVFQPAVTVVLNSSILNIHGS